MAFRLQVRRPAARFLASLSPTDRRRLFRCWFQLEQAPQVDGRTKFDRPHPPLLFAQQRCGDFLTVYHYPRYDPEGTVEVYECDWAADSPRVSQIYSVN